MHIYAWNPSKWKWIDLAYAVSLVNSGENYFGQRSCGRSKKSGFGDLFLLMKLGADPSGIDKGMIGCGHILGSPELIEHWDQNQRLDGKSILSTKIVFRALGDRPLITYDELVARFPSVQRTPQQSGISVSLEVAQEIFVELTGSQVLMTSLSGDQRVYFMEGESREIAIRTYDRCSRAREACISHHGHT